MSALDELNNKWERGDLRNPTPIEKLLLYEDSKYHTEAAAELADLRAENEQLKAQEKISQDAIKAAFHWINNFGMHSPIEFGGEQELHDILHIALTGDA